MPPDIDAFSGRGSGHNERLKSRKAAETGDPVEGMSDVLLLLDTRCRVRILRVPIFAGCGPLLLRQTWRLGMFLLLGFLLLCLKFLLVLRNFQIGVKGAGGRGVFQAEHLEAIDHSITSVSGFRK